MRRAAKVDSNHSAIVKALRAIGCSVLDLSRVGKGCPDLLVARVALDGRRRSVLLEVKDGERSPSRRKATTDQLDFFEHWRGEAYIVQSVAQAIEAMGA